MSRLLASLRSAITVGINVLGGVVRIALLELYSTAVPGQKHFTLLAVVLCYAFHSPDCIRW